MKRLEPAEVVSEEMCSFFAIAAKYAEVACTYCGHLCVGEPIYGSEDSSRYCSPVCTKLLYSISAFFNVYYNKKSTLVTFYF